MEGVSNSVEMRPSSTLSANWFFIIASIFLNPFGSSYSTGHSISLVRFPVFLGLGWYFYGGLLQKPVAAMAPKLRRNYIRYLVNLYSAAVPAGRTWLQSAVRLIVNFFRLELLF